MLSDVLFIMCALAVIGLSYFMLFKKPATPLTVEELRREEERRRTAQAPRANPANVEEARRRPAREQAPAEEEEDEDRQLTRAEQAKEAKKQAKKDRQEAERQAVEERKKREEAKADKEREKELKEEEKKKSEEETLRALKEAQKAKEEEEYKKWAQQMEVVESGDKKDEEPHEVKLQRFIDYIKLRKVVSLEDLSSRFKISNKEVLQRIRDLEGMDRLTGVVDDRGKYIFIKKSELEDIKRLIKAEGKISRVELVTQCSRMISLEPSREDKERIKKEEEDLILTLNSELMKEEPTS